MKKKTLSRPNFFFSPPLFFLLATSIFFTSSPLSSFHFSTPSHLISLLPPPLIFLSSSPTSYSTAGWERWWQERQDAPRLLLLHSQAGARQARLVLAGGRLLLHRRARMRWVGDVAPADLVPPSPSRCGCGHCSVSHACGSNGGGADLAWAMVERIWHVHMQKSILAKQKKNQSVYITQLWF